MYWRQRMHRTGITWYLSCFQHLLLKAAAAGCCWRQAGRLPDFGADSGHVPYDFCLCHLAKKSSFSCLPWVELCISSASSPVSSVKAHSKALCLSLFKTDLVSLTDPQNFFERTRLSYDVTGNWIFPVSHQHRVWWLVLFHHPLVQIGNPCCC